MMFNWNEEWNLSFAGCGFRSVYYLGALSCFLDRVPQLVYRATRICGASSGCLVAAAVTVGIPIGEVCGKDLLIQINVGGNVKQGNFCQAIKLLSQQYTYNIYLYNVYLSIVT